MTQRLRGLESESRTDCVDVNSALGNWKKKVNSRSARHLVDHLADDGGPAGGLR